MQYKLICYATIAEGENANAVTFKEHLTKMLRRIVQKLAPNKNTDAKLLKYESQSRGS